MERKLRELLPDEKGIRVRPAADSVILTGSKPWDTAAGSLLVQEAGGKVTDLEGKEQRYDRAINGFIASNGAIHQRLVALIHPLLK